MDTHSQNWLSHSQLPLSSTNHIGEVADAQTQISTSSDSILDLRSEVLAAVKANQPFDEVSKTVVGLIGKGSSQALNALRQHLADGPSGNSEKTTLLKGLGWDALKKEWAKSSNKSEVTREYELFRQEIVDRTWAVVVDALKDMGYSAPGKVVEFGTPGWNSDIDTVFLPAEDLPESMAVVAKLMFDMVVLVEVGQLPGFAMDTESYLNHAGNALKSEQRLLTDSGRAGFARTELDATNLQMVRQLGGVDAPQWHAYKEERLDAISDSKLQRSYAQSFAGVEAFERDLLDGVVGRGNNEDPALAKMGYKAAGLVALSEMMDSVKSDIVKKEQQLSHLSSLAGSSRHLDNQQILSDAHRGELTQANKLKAEVDQARLKLATMYLVRTSFFDEGYNTQGCYIAVCESDKGQMRQRGTERAKGRRQEEIQQQSPAMARKRDSLTASASRRLSLSLRSLSGLLPASAQPLVTKMAQGLRADTSPSQSVTPLASPRTLLPAQKVTPQQMKSLAEENDAMYRGHFSAKAEKLGVETSFIANSKYSERALSGAVALLEAAVKSDPTLSQSNQFAGLLRNLKECHLKVSHLEVAKRGQRLPSPVAKRLLLDELQKVGLAGDGAEQKVDRLLEACEKGLRESKFEGEIAALDLWAIPFSHLLESFNISLDVPGKIEGQNVTANQGINKVVFALLGLNKNEYDTEALFEGVAQKTLEQLNLNSPKSIESFNDQFKNLMLQTMVFVYNNCDILDKPAYRMDPTQVGDTQFSLQYFWQQANYKLKE